MNNIHITIVAAVAVAAVAAVLMGAQAVPSSQGHTMVTPDTSKIAIGAPIVAVNIPNTLSPGAQIGKRAYDTKCAQCHGADGAGTNGTAPPLIHSFYEPNHHSDYAFILAAKVGVQAHHWQFGDMPPVEGVSDAIVKDITLYIREVQKVNGIF